MGCDCMVPQSTAAHCRAAVEEEGELLRRQRELDDQDDGSIAFGPLDETWQKLALGLERLNRQINAKVRLLLRLQQRAAKEGTEPGAANSHAASPPESQDATGGASRLLRCVRTRSTQIRPTTPRRRHPTAPTKSTERSMATV
jgi:hypothetical protein